MNKDVKISMSATVGVNFVMKKARAAVMLATVSNHSCGMLDI
jgi:hypothetical protein